MKNLKAGVKYYGVVVATVKILPKDIGYLSAVRSNKVFYDEFIFTSARYEVPTIYYLSLIITFGLAGILFFMVKGFVFGRLNRVKGLE